MADASSKPTPPRAHDEIAVAYGPRDRTRSFISPSGMLPNDDLILATYNGGLISRYGDLLRDDQVKSAFEQRRSAVTSANWTVLPGGESALDKAAADYLTTNLDRIGWDRVTDLSLYGVFYGYSVAELLWDVFDGQFGWRDIRVRDRQRFEFTADGRCYLDIGAETERIYCERPYFWVFNSGADHGDSPHGRGLAHQLFWPVRFKRDGIRFWLIFLEKFAAPTAVGKFTPGAGIDVRSRLLQAVRAIQTETGVIIPNDTVIDLIEASRAGTSDYEPFYRRMDAAIQKIIVGQTLTAEVGETGGNRALGGVHMSVRQDIVKGDADLICDSFNRGPVRWLTDFNFPGAAYPRVIREVEQGEDLDKVAERWSKLYKIGYEPTLEAVQELFGAGMVKRKKMALPGLPGRPGGPFGRPDGGDEDPDQGEDDAAFAAAVAALFPDQVAFDGSIDAFAGRISKVGADITKPLLEYAATHTPSEMLEAIAVGLPGWEPGQVYDALARVMFVSRTLGRAHASD